MFDKETKKSDAKFNELSNMQTTLKSTLTVKIQKLEEKLTQLCGLEEVD